MQVALESGKENHLPDDVQQRITALFDRLAGVDGPGVIVGIGDIRATVFEMTDDDAEECATDMTELVLEVVRISAA